MAEGYLRYFAKENGVEMEVVSAGVETHGLNPRAVQVMSEAGVDISGQKSTLVDEYLNAGVTHLFSVCDHAKESCPVFPERVHHIHHSFPDPAGATGSEEEILDVFRATRDQVAAFAKGFVAGLNA